MSPALALIIDDSRAMRGIIRRIMNEIGFETHEVSHGREALDYLRDTSHKPNLILVDWNMPVVNGLDFVVQVRKQPTLDAVPLVMISSECEVCLLDAALKAGVSEYIMKPFTKQVVVDKLRLLGCFEGLLSN